MKQITLRTVPVSVNQLYRGRRFLTQKGKDMKDTMALELRSQYRGKPLECDIGLDIDFYVSNRRSDLDNLLKGTLDCMTGILYQDDKQIIQILTNKWVDKRNPRIEISINKYE